MIEDWQTEQDAPRDRWLLSYADLVTLLLAFFVVMYSVSAVNEAKLSELASTLSESFQSGGVTVDTDQQLNLPNAQEKMVQTLIKGLPGDAVIESNPESDSLVLNLPGEVLFISAASELSAAGKRHLLFLLPTLRHSLGAISVEGHTDNIPVMSVQFPSNWELSAHRAAATVRFLESQGVISESFRVVGFGDAQPLFSNDTEEGRRLNRRVVIRLEEVDWQALAESTQLIKTPALDDDLSLEEIDPALLEQVLRDLEGDE